jgi:hypothetical protein
MITCDKNGNMLDLFEMSINHSKAKEIRKNRGISQFYGWFSNRYILRYYR